MRLTLPFSLVFAQLLLVCPLAALAYFQDPVLAYSVLLGGLISALPGAYAALGVSRTVHVSQAFRVIGGELGRLALTAAGFALVFSLVQPLRSEALLGTFLLLQVSYLVVPLLLR